MVAHGCGQCPAGTAVVGAAGPVAHAGAQRLRAGRADRPAARLEIAVARSRGRGVSRDAMSRIGRLALPALGLALLMLLLHDADLAAPHLAPLLLPLLLAVPFTVWSGGVAAGRRLQRAGWLSVRKSAGRRDAAPTSAACSCRPLRRPAATGDEPPRPGRAGAGQCGAGGAGFCCRVPRCHRSCRRLLAFVPALQETAAEPLQPVLVAAATTAAGAQPALQAGQHHRRRGAPGAPTRRWHRGSAPRTAEATSSSMPGRAKRQRAHRRIRAFPSGRCELHRLDQYPAFLCQQR